MWCVLFAVIPPQEPDPSPAPIAVALAPAPEDSKAAPRWSPKGAKVALHADGETLVGAFPLGPKGVREVAVRLTKTAGQAHADLLAIDLDRDGEFAEGEVFPCTPKEQRGKWWSSFSATPGIPVPTDAATTASTRPYPMNLWFVEDPAEPDAAPALRWSRRGFQIGTVDVLGKAVFVQVSEMEMDGVFDQRDAWALAHSEAELAAAPPRSLEQHCWLDGKAYRAIAIDAHGRSLRFEAFEPGFTEAEEKAKADTLKPDREAPRAAAPLAWGNDLAAALVAAKRDGKRVLVDFHTTWCGPCKTMDQFVWTAADVVEAASGCVPVQLDGDEVRDVVKRYTVEGYPTMLLLDADGAVVRRAVGYRSVQAMVEFLATK